MRVLIGDETGLFKSVAIEANKEKILCASEQQQSRLRGIQRLCWSNNPDAVVVARSDASIEHYSGFIQPEHLKWKCTATSGKCVGLEYIYASESVLRATQNGVIEMYLAKEKKLLPIAQVASGLEQMRLDSVSTDSIQSQNHFAIGGKEIDLQLWSIETQQLLFRAKNVKHDNLQLQVPIWIKDLQFLKSDNSRQKIVVGTKYGHMRLYDTKAQRRPVQSIEFDEYPINTMCVDPSGTLVYTADTTGNVDAVDLRTLSRLGRFVGPSGAVRGIACHPSLPYMACAGLDRMVHVFNTTTRKSEYILYAKQRLNAILFCDDGLEAIETEDFDVQKKRRKVETHSEPSDEEEECPYEDLEITEEDSEIEETIEEACAYD